MSYQIDSLDPTTLARQGAGPLASASSLTVTERLDKAGSIGLTLPATDVWADLLTPDTLHYVRAFAMRGPTLVEAGTGLIRGRRTGSVSRELQLDGGDMLADLMRDIVGRMALESAPGSGLPMAAATILTTVLAGTGWTWTGVPSKSIYLQFGDERHLAALIKIADLTGDHFRVSRTVPRELQWLGTTAAGFDATDSTVRVIDSADPYAVQFNDDVVLLDGELSQIIDTTERVTRLYPRGGGNADAALFLNGLTLFGATVVPANTAGTWTDGAYTLVINTTNPDLSYIAHTVKDAAGRVADAPTYRDIVALEGTAAPTSASNQLAVTARVELQRRLTEQTAVQFSFTKLRKDLRVGQSVQLDIRHFEGTRAWMNIQRPALVMELTATWSPSSPEATYTGTFTL